MAQFIRERLAEAQHIGLAGEIDRHARAGLKAGDRRDQHDLAPPARDHAGQYEVGQLGQRDDVDLQHLADPRRIDPVEPAQGAEPGVVDQDVDREAAAGDVMRQGGGGAGLRQIGRDHRRGGAQRLEFRG